MAQRKIQFGRGNAMVEMPDIWREIAQRAMSNATNRRILERLEREAEEMRQYAHSKWPVSYATNRRDHRSRDALDSGVRLVPPDRFDGYLRLDPDHPSGAAGWAWHIKSAKVTSHRGNPVRAYMHAQGRKRSKKVAKELAADLVKALEGGS